MNRAACLLYGSVLFCVFNVAGCGGGTSSGPPPPPPNPAPTISSIAPSFATAGSGDTQVKISGTGFIASSSAQWNGTAISSTFVSGTELMATVPAADLAGSSASSISVENPAPGGGTSTAIPFNVNSPAAAITGISPRYVPPGAAVTVMVTGTGFESNSVVMWNGAAKQTTFVNSTTLTVSLSATDLQNQGTGALTVSSPGPGASTSAAAQLTVTSQPIPVIQSVSVTNIPGAATGCSGLQVTITGQNFAFDSTIQANNVPLPTIFYGPNPPVLINNLPSGFTSAAGGLVFTVTNPDGGPVISNPYAYPATNPAVMAICATPSPTTVFAGSGFSINIQASIVNGSGSATVAVGALPAGITTATASVALPSSGATLHLQAASTTAAGQYDIKLNGAAGSATSSADFDFTLSTGTPPGFNFVTPLTNEVGVPIGGSGSIQYQSEVGSNSSVDYDVTPSVSGSPPGTTASFTPSVFSVGQAVTVTLTAASTAPVTQNALVTLTGTPTSTAVASSTGSFYADVTQPPGSLPGNRTDFVAIAGTPYAAVYDAAHNLIFASNPDWNRVDVISNATHQVVKRIPVRSPRGLDITQDKSHVWVQTASPNVYEINTMTFQATHFSIPSGPVASGVGPVSINNDRDKLLALSDGTLIVYFEYANAAGVWNPQTNQMTAIGSASYTGWGAPARSGDGTRVYAPYTNGLNSGMEVYNVSTQSTSLISGVGYLVVAVNGDGSRLVLQNGNGPGLYDGNVNLLGTVPGTLTGFYGTPLVGGLVFSDDGTKLYEVGEYENVAVILSINSSNLSVLGTAPSSFSNFSFGGGSGASPTPTPFAVDGSGLVLAVQTYGISFEDSTFYQTYAAYQPNSSGSSAPATPVSGPLAGGTTSSLYAFPALQPDVWFGQTRGSTSLSQGQLTFTSPPSTTPGPTNVKFNYPDGEQAFYPQLFGYSTFPEYALTSGSSPNGGATGQVVGYGLPQDPSQGTVTVGGNTATITTLKGQYPPLSGEPYPSTILNYTFPAGTPGLADLQVSTPIGSGSLAKAILYAKSVNDYSSSDTFAAVIYDAKRKQVYLSAGDHVDVFSLGSNQFVAPLQPAANGATKQFAGLALTPDGSKLLVADLLDGSVAVINPDSPASTFAVPIAAASVSTATGCEVGPLYVAATSTNQAFVSYGSLPGSTCQIFGNVYLVNLTTHGVTQPAQCSTADSLDATSDGNFVAIGGQFCLYSASGSSYNLQTSIPTRGTIAISGDGNVLGSALTLTDSSLNAIGSVSLPIPYYGNLSDPSYPTGLLFFPRLNASGSLYFFSYPNYFEIVDVQHARLRMRFPLAQTIQGVIAPMAIDSGGRYIFLITDKGLTAVDLGTALLSIGHLSQQNAGPGTQITVRGSGFESSIAATVGGVAATVVFTDENTMTLTIPSAASGAEDIVLTRGDGETYTLENGVVLP